MKLTILKDYNVGKLYSNWYYFTERKTIPHYYIKGQGYPVSDSILQDLKLMGCNTIYIMETKKDGSIQHYQTPLTNYLKSKLFQEKEHDKQRCYPLNNMEKHKTLRVNGVDIN